MEQGKSESSATFRPALIKGSGAVSDKARTPHRIPSLDGIRAISIVMVLVCHFAYSAGAPIRNSWLTDAYAHYGVMTFFVISGFLITTLLEKEREKTGSINLKQFYIRRAWRILPVSYVYMIVIAVLFYSTFTARELTLAFTYLSSYAHLPWSFSHLWSLSVEEQFYLLWPVAAAISAAVSRRFAVGAILLSPVLRFVLEKKGIFVLGTLPTSADSLACGCLLALCQSRLKEFRGFFSWRGFPVVWGLTFSIPLFEHYLIRSQEIPILWPLPQLLGYSAVTLFNFGVALCIQSAIVAPPKILNAAVPVWIGTLSYSLYIWQMPFANPNIHSWATRFPENILLAVLAAVISFYAIEQPFLRLRDRLAKPRASAAAAALGGGGIL